MLYASPSLADADRRDHRDEVARIEQLDDLRVDALDLADEADVDVLAVVAPSCSSILRAWMNAPSWPVSPTALPPCWLMSPTISWLSSPSTISTTFITRSSVTRMPCRNSLLMPILLQEVADLRAAAVHDDRIHADELQHHDVAREAGLELRLGHRVAAVLDDDRLVVEAPDVRQRLGEDLRLHARR